MPYITKKQEKVITHEPTETIMVKWDGTRFAVLTIKLPMHRYLKPRKHYATEIVLLNPREARELTQFIEEVLNGKGV